MVSIGPAGERLVRYACVQNDLEHYNGRTGMGAVMGSKNLKAIAVRGTQKLQMADPEKVKEIGRWHNERIKTHPPNVGLTKFGTTGLVKGINDGGFLPTRNFKEGVFEGADKLSAPAYHETIFHSNSTCWACAVRCKRRVELAHEKYPLDKRFGGAEYESLAALGSMLAIDNLPAVAHGNQICNLQGLDVVSTGAVIAFAMECFENGILTEADTGGRTLRYGDADAMIWLIEQIASRTRTGRRAGRGGQAGRREDRPRARRNSPSTSRARSWRSTTAAAKPAWRWALPSRPPAPTTSKPRTTWPFRATA